MPPRPTGGDGQRSEGAGHESSFAKQRLMVSPASSAYESSVDSMTASRGGRHRSPNPCAWSADRSWSRPLSAAGPDSRASTRSIHEW